MIDLNKIVEEVLIIAENAGGAIMEIYDENDFNVESKSDDSPVTKADKTANALICEQLAQLDFQCPILSEEGYLIPYEERKNLEYYWLVDPLDGTREFINRNGDFTVNIALIHKQRPVLGVVYVPVWNEMYYATEGNGAYLLGKEDKKKLVAPTFSWKDKGLKVLISRSHQTQETLDYIDTLNEPELVTRGSSLKFLMIAKGEAHVYPRLSPIMEWDSAAAHVILTESGGNMMQLATQTPVVYNKEDLRNPNFLAYGNAI